MVPFGVQDEDLSVRRSGFCAVHGLTACRYLSTPSTSSSACMAARPSSRCAPSYIFLSSRRGKLIAPRLRRTQGRIYGPVDTASSVWQLEPLRTQGRERTASTASTVSTHSSYAFVSDPDISSSFAASLESGPASDAEDVYSPSPALSSPTLSFTDEVLFPAQLPAHRRKRPLDPAHGGGGGGSRSVSPGQGTAARAQPSMASSLSSLESAQHAPRGGRLLTVHLEKEKSTIWPSLVVGPVPEDLASSIANTVVVFDAAAEAAAVNKFNMDPTSLALIALELCDIRKEKEEAFEYFL